MALRVARLSLVSLAAIALVADSSASSGVAPTAAREEVDALDALWFLRGEDVALDPADVVAYADLRVNHFGSGIAATAPIAPRPTCHSNSGIDSDTVACASAPAPSGKGRGLVQRTLRVAVLGTHGPLSALLGDHVLAAATTVDSDLDLVLYGQCYLCAEIPSCKRWHSPSGADRGCDWFQEAPSWDAAALQSEVRSVAMELLAHEPSLAGMLCEGLLLCHYLFALMPAALPRIQVFCMNLLQGVPEPAARPMLRALNSRLASGERVFTTNVVTSALCAYHLGRPLVPPWAARSVPQALALFPGDLHAVGWRMPWSADSCGILFARNFILLHDPTTVAFGEAPRPPGGHLRRLVRSPNPSRSTRSRKVPCCWRLREHGLRRREARRFHMGSRRAGALRPRRRWRGQGIVLVAFR
mmetsp:Transcript_98946/g.279544  ORF Transcript_98946/g.279544 Transcript_98946/m.279544 type:complete len:414 (-) Transcript_98946:84-1325(-)